MAKAKTKKPSKSAAIREALAATPDKSANEIAKELKVTPALVYNVKAGMKKKTGKASGKKRGRKPGQKAASNGAAPHAAHAALDSAFEFVTKVGGLIHAEQLIAKLRTFKEKL
jgi:transposase